MTKLPDGRLAVLKFLTGPFMAYWKVLDTVFFIWRPGLIKWVFTITLIFSAFRGIVYYPLTKDPTMPIRLIGWTIETPYLLGKFPVPWLLLTILVYAVIFTFSYKGLAGRDITRNYPVSRLPAVWTVLVIGILLGWTVW